VNGISTGVKTCGPETGFVWIRIILGRRIRIHIILGRLILIRIKVKIGAVKAQNGDMDMDVWRFKIEPWRAVDARNGGVEA
jgi:hypothetical protein